MHLKTRFIGAAVATAALIAGAGVALADGDHPGIDPEHVEAVVLPGQSIDVEKTVHVPELPPVLDMCLVVDLSGSYADDLVNIKLLAPGIWDAIVAGGVSDLQAGLASFVDFPFGPWGSAVSGDYAYSLDQQLTSTKATWVAAVNGMVTRFGGDEPESQYEALYQLATGAGNDVLAAEPDDVGDVAAGQQCAFRADATKVAILTTDASFHNAGDAGPFPYPGASAAATTAALQAAGIKVIGLKAPGAGGELDALAAATGGTTVATTSNSSDIASAILAALEEITVEVAMESDCATVTGGVISTSFAPGPQVVQNGGHAVFTETISVAADAPGGVYECTDTPLIDGVPMVDGVGNPIVETKRILVPENFVTGGGHITNGEKGKNRTTLLNFGGNAGYMPDGTLVGHWTFNFQAAGVKVNTTEITRLQFFDAGDPAPPEADANIAYMEAEARVNVNNTGWVDGCYVLAYFEDNGEPQADVVGAVEVSCAGVPTFVYQPLTGGNIQIHEGTK